MRERVLFAASIAALLAGCSGGGGGGSSPVSPVGVTSPGGGSGAASMQADSEQAIASQNAFGSPLKTFADYDTDIATVAGSSATAVRTSAAASGTCDNGIEFFAPDRNGEANSTERIDYYDAACTIEARDTVRLYTAQSASAETVAVNVSLFAPGNATPIATRSESHAISNATFNANGFPIAADGFDLSANETFDIASAKTFVSSRELVMEAATSGTNGFCSDSAGYNATGFQKLHETFGWQGGVLSGGTRTVNADGSTTWTATHAGTTYKGAVGGLSIQNGVQNTSCPIATPGFTLAGGTSTGTYSIPVVVTYAHGLVERLTITNAILPNGDTLAVTTNSGVTYTSNLFITGIVSSGTTQISTFAVNAFGDGTLTVTATGAQYVITDWHVV